MARERTTVVKLPSRANLGDLDDLLEALRPLHRGTDGAIVLDLEDLSFVGPTCLAVVVASCCRASPGQIAEVRLPRNQGVRRYLERMDTFELIPCEVPSAGGGRRTADGFRECRRFDSLDECVDASRQLVGAISESCELDHRSRQSLMTCIAELAENVHFHADSQDGGYAVAQTWPKLRRLEVGIVDMGRGIRRSLTENARHASLRSDEDAIRSAFELGVTATPERNTGQGLFSTARLLERNGGHVLVRSGSGLVVDGSVRRSETASDFPGTLVSLTIDTGNPLDGGAVARLIGELKGGEEDDDDLFD
jgi:anti-sigma regulatory factor (Ser/Thr protein kinase)